MGNLWREIGMSYVQYSNTCAKVVRRAYKQPLRTQAMVRDSTLVKVTHWEDGNPKASGGAK